VQPSTPLGPDQVNVIYYIYIHETVGQQPFLTAVSIKEPLSSLKIAISHMLEVQTSILTVTFNGAKATTSQILMRGELRLHISSSTITVRPPYYWAFVTYQGETHEVSVNQHNEVEHISAFSRRQWGLRRGEFIINRTEDFRSSGSEVHITIVRDEKPRLRGGCPNQRVRIGLWDGEQRREVWIQSSEWRANIAAIEAAVGYPIQWVRAEGGKQWNVAVKEEMTLEIPHNSDRVEQVYVYDEERGQCYLYALDKREPMRTLWECLEWRLGTGKPMLWYEQRTYDGTPLLKHMELRIRQNERQGTAVIRQEWETRIERARQPKCLTLFLTRHGETPQEIRINRKPACEEATRAAEERWGPSRLMVRHKPLKEQEVKDEMTIETERKLKWGYETISIQIRNDTHEMEIRVHRGAYLSEIARAAQKKFGYEIREIDVRREDGSPQPPHMMKEERLYTAGAIWAPQRRDQAVPRRGRAEEEGVDWLP
jgi:hypothetical protein